MSYISPLSFDLSPTRLNYVGALRGLKPKSPDTAFIYAQTGLFDSETLVCLAASNPQAQFYGVIPNDQLLSYAQKVAKDRMISNISFVNSLDLLPPKLDYLSAEYTQTPPSDAERETLFTTAETKLVPGGYFCFRYRAYENPDQILQFLISEYVPDLSTEQAQEFLEEIKALGSSYFADHPIARTALDKAMESKTPNTFFDACVSKEQDVISGTFETMASLLPRDFSFVGDADFGANYIELAAPAAAHSTLDKCNDHLLYEPIKDFALQRLIRNDVWVKRPVEQTFENSELFGNFTFGITALRDHVPSSVTTQAGTIHLSTPIFTRLIDLMSSMPIGIGDFLHHPAGLGMNPDEVVAAINVLVACDIAQPMRARYEGQKKGDVMRPVWSNNFNALLNTIEISEPTIRLASSVTGSVVTLTAREALVLQAVNRVGLSLCAGSLQPELERLIIKNPTLATQIMEAAEPTDDVVHKIVVNVLTDSMPRWFAYGLLAA
ncbi:MAG: methyltransferase regulatory domain-containing protein [Alphaproteobacteria bacterium]|nr:methyltransferase regulatory domain-containing protein [Alphaproteobacteria bacterium]